MRKVSIAVVLAAGAATFVAGSATPAAQRVKASDMAVHSYFMDVDASGASYTLQSDGSGGYVNDVDNVVSVLMKNVYNQLYNGDWEMDATSSTVRTVAVTLSTANAVPAGSAGYTVPPDPPFWGTGFEAARVIDFCTKYGKDVLTMQANTTITCPLEVNWNPGTGLTYTLTMSGQSGAPETSPAQISCNSVDAIGCNDWFIDPIPVVNADGTVAPGQATGRLRSVTRNGTTTNLGDFYMTFHFHITRP